MGVDVSMANRANLRRVLIVDDEHVIADTLAVIFQQAGYEACTAYDGREGLQKAREFQPDFLISDVVMPDMDGIELAIQITREFPESRVLLISGQTSVVPITGCATRGGYSFPLIGKPVHPHELLEGIAQFIAEAGKSVH
jgi:DNA-binding response OmpR family regulator